MATYGLKEMGKFLWEGTEKSLPSWLSQFSFAKLGLEASFPQKPVVKETGCFAYQSRRTKSKQLQ